MDQFDCGEIKATLGPDGVVSLAFAPGLPVAPGPIVQVKQTTVLLLATWVQSKITGAKFEEFQKEPVQGKKPRDLEDIKKFIDDLKVKLPGIISEIRKVHQHPLDKAMESALSGVLREIVEEIMSSEPTLRERYKELIKNHMEDAVAQDENWRQGGEDGGEEQS